tara:strand:- start:3982 stop:5172 length:1191 start_codon:yes stop_codon:yes gene_type:complete
MSEAGCLRTGHFNEISCEELMIEGQVDFNDNLDCEEIESHIVLSTHMVAANVKVDDNLLMNEPMDIALTNGNIHRRNHRPGVYHQPTRICSDYGSFPGGVTVVKPGRILDSDDLEMVDATVWKDLPLLSKASDSFSITDKGIQNSNSLPLTTCIGSNTISVPQEGQTDLTYTSHINGIDAVTIVADIHKIDCGSGSTVYCNHNGSEETWLGLPKAEFLGQCVKIYLTRDIVPPIVDDAHKPLKIITGPNSLSGPRVDYTGGDITPAQMLVANTRDLISRRSIFCGRGYDIATGDKVINLDSLQLGLPHEISMRCTSGQLFNADGGLADEQNTTFGIGTTITATVVEMVGAFNGLLGWGTPPSRGVWMIEVLAKSRGRGNQLGTNGLLKTFSFAQTV